MSSEILVMAALGRPFTLGTLYDARQDSLLPGFTLWEKEDLEGNTLDSPQPSSVFQISASDSVDEKANLLDVEASLKASFLGGLIEVGGSAKYLNDTKKFKSQSRVTLQYKATTNFKQLMTNLGGKHVEYSEKLANLQATHVVIGILYGANAFFVFDSDKIDTANVQEIQGSMEAVIKKIPSVEISGQGSVKLTEDESTITNGFTCKFIGDIILTSNPTTFEDAVQTYAQLPSMMGTENSVPLKVWLVPLTNFYPDVPQVVPESSTPIVRKARNILEAIRQLEMRCNDALDEKVVQKFPELKKKLSNFQNLCTDYMLNLRQAIADKLTALRSGEEDGEDALERVFEDHERSPFNINSLNQWMECEEREINIVNSCMEIMKEAKPKVVSSKSQLFRELMDSDVKHALCFVFTYVVDYDPFLSVLSEYSDTGKRIGNPKKLRPPVKDYWFTSDKMANMIRDKAHTFCQLAKEINNRTVHFFVASIENRKQEGAGIHYYREGILIIDEFTKPYMPRVEGIQDRRELHWYDCELTLDPDTAHPALILSDKNKKVKSGKRQSYSDNSDRFDFFQQVLCKQALTGRHYWEVEWTGFVRAGVTYRGIRRKSSADECSLGYGDKSWVFDYYPTSGYHVIHKAKKERLTFSKHNFTKLGIYLDWPAGTLSFYMIATNLVTHIHTFHTTFQEPVYPGFLVGFPGGIKNGHVKLL
uniref:Sftoxin alpha-subunit n=1 Tax=Siganus fuscescens TaxID=225757 RepID=A0A173MRY0_SIGFU|nr:sftoxin alpha-subunit [Siganus fuscescens]BAV13028.1 sftoxin alpha-subunit [Siganus fuscescens]